MWALVAILGLAAGVLVSHYNNHQQQPDAPTPRGQEQDTELKTDAFSLRLFQHALAGSEARNVLVAPHTLARVLTALQELAGGKTLQELQGLQLCSGAEIRSCEPVSAALLGMDYNLPRQEMAGLVMALPFSEDVPMALSLFNGMLASATGRPDAQLVSSNMVTNRTRLLAGCTIHFKANWEIPFHQADTRTADFDNASGGMPHFRQMRSRGLYRCTSAADGSWKAVALPMKAENGSPIPLYFIAILPAGHARDFAAALTTEQLTEIRRSLASASIQDTLVELPRQELQIQPFDMRDSLRRMGLKALFDSETADFSRLTPEKIHLAALVHAVDVSLTESPGRTIPDTELDYAPHCLSFNRPFVWLVADLATSTPVEFMGLVQEM